MKDSEIEQLLRQEHELETPRPGLDQRIQANLPNESRGFPVLRVASLAALVIVMGFVLSRQKPVVEEKSRIVQVMDEPIRVSLKNPLEEEAVALQATAKKTASFLLSRFPSLPKEKS